MTAEQDFQSHDEVLEYAARLIEETDITDLRGVWAKRKRDREDAQLRLDTAEHIRKRCAEHIRAMKNRPDLRPEGVLREIAEAKEGYLGHVMHLRDAWPLTWKGWVNVECAIKCNSNSIPPEVVYRITLTEKGQKILAGDVAPEVAP